MKKFLLFFLLVGFILPTNALAQTPSWVWAKINSGNGNSGGYSTATDNLGNVYVAGFYGASPLVIGTYSLAIFGGSDFFIAKLNSVGNVLWVNGVGGSSADYARDITVDLQGNVYIVGESNSPIIHFGSTSYNNPNSGFTNVIIAKYTSSGNFVWAHNSGGIMNNDNIGRSIAVDNHSNIYITGEFSSSNIVLGSTLNNYSSSGTKDVFTAKYDSSGNIKWAKSAGGSTDDSGYGITTDAQFNLCVTGFFTSNIISFSTYTLTNVNNGDDVFITKYDSLGNVVWAKSAGGQGLDDPEGIITDAASNVYITGSFDGVSMNFDSYIIYNASTGGFNDIFTAKYSSTGNFIWAKQAGGPKFDYSYGIANDNLANVYITGQFYKGTIIFGYDTLISNINGGIYVTKYDSSGNIKWGVSAGTIANTGAAAIAFDGNSSVYVTGRFIGNSCNFGSDTVNSSGNGSFYITKLDNIFANDIRVFSSKNSSFSIYPNPSNNNITIQSVTELGTIAIYNSLGEIVLQTKSKSEHEQIDISKLPMGIYVVQAHSKYMKLVKE